jgi:hypothetical protein
MLPLWQRGMEGDFKDTCLFIIHKISPCPSFPKRGMSGTILKLTIYVTKWTKYINSKIFGIGHEPILIFAGNSNLITKIFFVIMIPQQLYILIK